MFASTGKSVANKKKIKQRKFCMQTDYERKKKIEVKTRDCVESMDERTNVLLGKRQKNSVWCIENRIWTGLKIVDAYARAGACVFVCVGTISMYACVNVCCPRTHSNILCVFYPLYLRAHTRIIFWRFFSFICFWLLLYSSEWLPLSVFVFINDLVWYTRYSLDTQYTFTLFFPLFPLAAIFSLSLLC